MSDWQEKARKILDSLAKEHGSEAFVSDGYAYYYDAEETFAAALKDAYEQGRRAERENQPTKEREPK